jgi:SAM-dependent methyltransferase
MKGYCDQDWRRFVYTWGLVCDLKGKCLELGSNPYFTTVLLRQFTPLELTLANYFSPTQQSTGTQRVFYRDFHTDERKDVPFPYYHFSVESDSFPFPKDTFDVVLFCEIIEHLQNDPAAVLREIHRVLKRGGTLVLTTPNVSRLENVARMVSGANIYDPYSGYGPYGRHNREYNKHELHLLLKYCGFDVETMFTADVHENRANEFCRLDLLTEMLKFRESDLGQYIFVRCHARRAPSTKRPSWLYRSYPQGELE